MILKDTKIDFYGCGKRADKWLGFISVKYDTLNKTLQQFQRNFCPALEEVANFSLSAAARFDTSSAFKLTVFLMFKSRSPIKRTPFHRLLRRLALLHHRHQRLAAFLPIIRLNFQLQLPFPLQRLLILQHLQRIILFLRCFSLLPVGPRGPTREIRFVIVRFSFKRARSQRHRRQRVPPQQRLRQVRHPGFAGQRDRFLGFA